MDLDLSDMSPEDAELLVMELLNQLISARADVEHAQRRASGLRKMIDGLVEVFPTTEDLLPDDLDPEEPRPRGADAVWQVLSQRPNEFFSVGNVLTLLNKAGWAPNSSNPANAVRTALERLVDRKMIEKTRSKQGGVVYGIGPTYDYGEEPF